MSLTLLKKTLRKYATLERKKSNKCFFKTGKGQYGYKDKFIGITVPDIRKVVSQFYNLSFVDIKKLLQSKIHEERLAALLLLVHKFENGDNKKKKQIYNFYLRYFKYVNNWDLVDLSSYKIVGAYILENPKYKKLLTKYTKSKNLWEKRLSIVATWIFIKNNKFDLTMENATSLLSDPHDLTHKAVGWMLREVWKKNNTLVESFLITNYKQIPRTTLRYAIERMGETKRKQFLKGF